MNKTDFEPYRAEFRDCACDTCMNVATALSDVLDFDGSKHYRACEVLLSELRSGTHQHVSYAERGEIAKRAKEVRLAEARARGADAEELLFIERGYVKVQLSDLKGGSPGIGMTPRGVR